MHGNLELIKNIYNCIEDDLSRDIFINRINFSISNDTSFIKRIISTTQEGKDFLNKIYCDKRKVIFGAGSWGKEIVHTFRDIKFDYIIDNNEKICNQYINGIKVIRFEEFLKLNADYQIIISTRLYYNEIYNQLISNSINKENILNAGSILDLMCKKQYFDLPYLTKDNDEAFVDAGCFDGLTSIEFIKWCNYKFKKIWAFEPESRNIIKAESNIRNTILKNKVEGEFDIIKRGLWDKKEQLCFETDKNGASKISETGAIMIDVDRLDEMIPVDQRVTFIKMDLEGAEINAIKGAQRIIKTYHPKLAISVYHRMDDIVNIPALINKYSNDYRFYFRHYSIGAAETVLYAI